MESISPDDRREYGICGSAGGYAQGGVDEEKAVDALPTGE
jgi:hypothetical protein